MAGKRILIAGGGVGGIVTANALRKRLPKEHKITIVERSRTFHMGATKTWVMLGERTSKQVSIPLDRLKKRGIDTQLVVYPDTHHGGWSEEFEKDRLLRIHQWFDKYLQPGRARAQAP